MHIEGIKLSQHAKERYAERIMGKEDQMSVSQFVATHEEKIATDIGKMIEYGNVVYTGKSIKSSDRQTDVIISGLWCLVLDSRDHTVITLFKVDLGLGDEFNKEFLSRSLDRLADAQKEYQETVAAVKNENAEYETQISDNELMIADLKKRISNLEELNNGYRKVIQESKAREVEADAKVREVLDGLLGKYKY